VGKNTKENRNWKKQRSIESIKGINNKYYFFCEGEKTEPLYFEGIKRKIENNAIYKNSVFIKVDGVGAETLRVIYEAERFVDENNINNAQIWIVYDKDSFPAADFNGVSQYAQKLNSIQNKVVYKVAWSNQCIEYWFILHFDYYVSDNDRKYYIEYLNSKFKDLKLGKYTKNDKDIFSKMFLYGNPEMAIKYAKKRLVENAGKNESDIVPATMVHNLYEELSQYF
jgi:hypothetical protein